MAKRRSKKSTNWIHHKPNITVPIIAEEKAKTIRVEIDSKTVIMVKPGTDIDKIKAKYLNRTNSF